MSLLIGARQIGIDVWEHAIYACRQDDELCGLAQWRLRRFRVGPELRLEKNGNTSLRVELEECHSVRPAKPSAPEAGLDDDMDVPEHTPMGGCG